MKIVAIEFFNSLSEADTTAKFLCDNHNHPITRVEDKTKLNYHTTHFKTGAINNTDADKSYNLELKNIMDRVDNHTRHELVWCVHVS